ncbi:MAG TPA: CheR family methyltransferase [Acidimicrobiia bacterium]|nr:CheR family methyltransferase [Acidimicrobiia bacterium]
MSGDSTTDPGDLDALLDYVKRTRDFDFTGYKRPTLTRRIAKRMAEVGCTTYSDYEDHLALHPEEFVTFFNAILINVTGFFRDPQAWEFMADEIVPRIISGKDPAASIRVWSAGCASGEEAYTIAMLFGRALGIDGFRSRVKVYATDIDDEALAEARAATFTEKALEAVPEELRGQYFEETTRGVSFRSDLRRNVIFGRHDLLRDAPISRLDLLVCRNTLMYFTADSQNAVVDRFRFALERGGYLFLGRAETLLTHSRTFRPLQLQLRIFETVTEQRSQQSLEPRDDSEPAAGSDWPRAKLRDAAFDAGANASMVVDVDGVVQSVNASARALFGITPAQLGGTLQDFEMSYRPLELRSIIEQAYAERTAIERRSVEWPFRDTIRLFDVIVTPLFEVPSGAPSGASITFSDVTRFRQLEIELEQSTLQLQTAYEELQSTNEELETMNEELQSTNEELQSTNEELQSTNEELETMNEELQSTNDEFHVVNEMLNARGVELDRANMYLHSVLSGIDAGVVVLDDELVVQIWNHRSQDLWGLRPVEVEGKHLMNIDIGLPASELVALVRSTLENGTRSRRVTLNARNRRGRQFSCHVTCSPIESGDHAMGVVVLMEDVDSAN